MTLTVSSGNLALEGRTPEQIAEGVACIEALIDLFRPHVRAAVAKAVDEALKAPMTRREVDLEIAAVATGRNDKAWMEFLAKPLLIVYLLGLRAWVGKKGKILRYSARGRRKVLEHAAETMVQELVRDWLSLLSELAELSGMRTLIRSELDDRMLTRSVFVENAFDDPTGLDPKRDIACAALQAVRLSLPPGRVLPEAAERFLRLEGYDIRDYASSEN